MAKLAQESDQICNLIKAVWSYLQVQVDDQIWSPGVQDWGEVRQLIGQCQYNGWGGAAFLPPVSRFFHCHDWKIVVQLVR